MRFSLLKTTINSNYKITDKESFSHTSQWLIECKDLKREDAIFCLVGNKLDMNDARQVSHAEAQAQAKEKGLIFQEVSAKSGLNVNDLFYKDIFDQIMRKYNRGDINEIDSQEDNAKDYAQRSNSYFIQFTFL